MIRTDRPESDHARRTRELMEQWLKTGDHVIRKELDDLLEESLNRRTPEFPYFLKHYEKGTLEIHIEFVLRNRSFKPEGTGQYCVILEGDAQYISACLKEEVGGNFPRNVVDASDMNCRDMQSSMFVDIREFLKKPQWMLGRVLPSAIRLHRVDFSHCRIGQVPKVYRPSLLVRDGAIIQTFVGEDRKERPFRWLAAIGRNELIHEVIQGGPEVLDNLAGDQRDLMRWLLGYNDASDYPIRIRPILAEGKIWLAGEVAGDKIVEGFEVSARPLDL